MSFPFNNGNHYLVIFCNLLYNKPINKKGSYDMFQYQRLYNLLFYIYDHHHVLPATLAEQLNVSVRTIRSDVSIANDTLTKNGAEIILKRNHGYSLKITDKDRFHNFLNSSRTQLSRILDLETTENRISYLTRLLLTNNDYLSFEYLEQELCVTAPTLQNYIKRLKLISNPMN